MRATIDPAIETPFQWRFAGWPIVAGVCMLAGIPFDEDRLAMKTKRSVSARTSKKFDLAAAPFSVVMS